MCQAVVYMAQKDREHEIMRDVVLLEPVEEGVRLQAFFEEPVTLSASIGRIDFLKHTVTLVPVEEGQDGGDDRPWQVAGASAPLG